MKKRGRVNGIMCEMKLHSLFTALDITDIHLQHSAKHLQVDLHTFLCCLSEEISQTVAGKKRIA